MCLAFLGASEQEQAAHIGQADKILAALPRLPQLLQAVTAGQLFRFTNIQLYNLALCFHYVVLLCANWKGRNFAPCQQPASLPLWCAACAAALQALPAAVAAIGAVQSAAGVDVELAAWIRHNELDLGPKRPTRAALHLAEVVVELCKKAARCLPADSLAAAVPALCALHAQLCRLVRWSLTPEGSAVETLAQVRCWKQLLTFTATPLEAANSLLHTACDTGALGGRAAAEAR